MTKFTLRQILPRPGFCARALASIIAALGTWGAPTPAWACDHQTPFSQIIVFGDSLSDTGNLNRRSVSEQNGIDMRSLSSLFNYPDSYIFSL